VPQGFVLARREDRKWRIISYAEVKRVVTGQFVHIQEECVDVVHAEPRPTTDLRNVLPEVENRESPSGLVFQDDLRQFEQGWIARVAVPDHVDERPGIAVTEGGHKRRTESKSVVQGK